MNISRIAIAATALAGLLTACATVLTLPYVPQSTQELTGAVAIPDFTYTPEDGIAQNEIRETAAGRILLTENVGTFIANAVRREFRQSGLSLDPGSACSLEGEVIEFLVDSLGFSSDYKLEIRYILYGPAHRSMFDNTYVVEFNASKFVVMDIIIANLNKLVADNIKRLLTDPAFVHNLGSNCPSA